MRTSDTRLGPECLHNGGSVYTAETAEANKEREAGQGYDGTWVAHPDLVPVARAVFDAATAEISRSQIWQWVHQEVVTAEGTRLTGDSVEDVLTSVLDGPERFAGAVHSTASESSVAHIESAASPQDVRVRPPMTITNKRRSST